VVTLVSVARPFFAATYPPMTDLPFHAASASIFRHFWDPSFHFQEQFELHPLQVPYMSSYLLTAALMLLLPTLAAVKTATALMLLMLPAGLATLTWGMRKSPLLGLAGVPFVWGSLTHWGFINFVAAIGLYAAAIGLTLRILDRPERRVQLALGLVLVLLFFTHVFRLPFAIVGVLVTTAIMLPATGRARPVLLPLAPSVLLLAVFLALRPAALQGPSLDFVLHGERFEGFFDYVIGSFRDPAERAVARNHLIFVVLVGVASVLARHFVDKPERSANDLRFRRCAAVAVGGAVSLVGFAYLALPMELGVWWYVFPREATAVLFLAVALIPDLPRAFLLRAGVTVVLGMSSLGVTSVVTKNWQTFDAVTQDFSAISAHIPQAPKLCYLVMDHSGSTRANTPFIHLPAYVQAVRGGWLSFHFASFGASPVRYRADEGAVVPPPVPRRWEWTPKRFRVEDNGPFFDTFLVRDRSDPTRLFAADPSIVFVAREGSWWLYRREPIEPPAGP